MTTQKAASCLERADRTASQTVNHKRDSWLVRAVGALSDVADQPQMRLLCVGTTALGLIQRDGGLARTGVKMLAAHTVATWGKSRIKAVVDRTRPDSGDDPAARLGDSEAHEDNSFPSGHNAGAVAVARAFARNYPGHAVPAHAAALRCLRCRSRAVRTIGDVIAGALIGLAAEQAIDAVIKIGSSLIGDASDAPSSPC